MTMEGGSLGGFYLRLKDFEIQEGHRIIYLYTYILIIYVYCKYSHLSFASFVSGTILGLEMQWKLLVKLKIM